MTGSTGTPGTTLSVATATHGPCRAGRFCWRSADSDGTLKLKVDCLAGTVKLRFLELGWPRKRRPKCLNVVAKRNGKKIEASVLTENEVLVVALPEKTLLAKGDVLDIALRADASS